MGKIEIVWRDGYWVASNGHSVVRFASSTDAWTYKRQCELRWWQRLRKAA